MRKYINCVFVGIVSFLWASVYWLGDSNMWQVEKLVSLDLARPWVYRQLVSFLARAYMSVGIKADWALVLIVTLSGIGFYLALRELWFTLYRYDETEEIIPVMAVFVGTLLFGYNRLPYDLTTAFLFTLAFLYIFRADKVKYLVVFTLACLNRETAFLLILFYAVLSLIFFIGYKQLSYRYTLTMLLLQVYIYTLITYCLHLAFQYNAGSTLWVEPWQNLMRFANNLLLTLLHLSVTGVILWMVFRDWKYKSTYLKLAFWVIAPVMVLMYIVCGQNYEVRVFWEIYPVVGLLMIPKANLNLRKR